MLQDHGADKSADDLDFSWINHVNKTASHG